MWAAAIQSLRVASLYREDRECYLSAYEVVIARSIRGLFAGLTVVAKCCYISKASGSVVGFPGEYPR